jgi:hypothetical protein
MNIPNISHILKNIFAMIVESSWSTNKEEHVVFWSPLFSKKVFNHIGI